MSVEWSPEFSRWGFVGSLVIDVPITDWFGVDALFTFLHDQENDSWDEAQFYLGVGAGVSFVFGPLAISPSTSLFYGLTTPSFSLVPGVNASITF